MTNRIAQNIIIAITLVFTPHLIAENTGPFELSSEVSQPLQIRIYTESYEIGALEFAHLMTKPSLDNDHDALRNLLLEKAKLKQAKLISNHSIICRSGGKSTLESVREFIYPAEYNPSVGPPMKKGEINEFKIESRPHSYFPPTPTAFQTRNLGDTLEIEPTLGDDRKTIDLRLAPESVKHVGDHILSLWEFNFAKIKIARPIFYTQRSNTSVTLTDGKFLLATTYSPELEGKSDHSRKVLHFIRAEVLVVGAE